MAETSTAVFSAELFGTRTFQSGRQIGAVARDPKSLAAWYRQALGVDIVAGTPLGKCQWREREDSSRLGSTARSLFPSESKDVGGPFMINYRVRNLEAMLAQVRALGVAVDGKVTEDVNGSSRWIVDPEGNKIELWEPKSGD